MARKMRFEYPGAIYHVMSRGNRREEIFIDDDDRRNFITGLGQVCEKSEWQIHAFCLMSNHFHLVVETPQANLVAGMKWLLGTYTNRFNHRHRLCGHLFSGRYKSLLVDGNGNGYLRTVCEYVLLNPVRASLIKADEPLQVYRWSSYPIYLNTPEEKPAWLRVDRVLGEYGIASNSEDARREFGLLLEMRRHEETRERWNGLRRAWLHGSQEFKEDLLRQLNEKRGVLQYGNEPPESPEFRANEIVLRELRLFDCSEDELSKRPKKDSLKMHIAKCLRQETVMPLRWIANRLQIGSVNTLRNALYHDRQNARLEVTQAAKEASMPAIGKQELKPKASKSSSESFNVSWD